MGTPMKQPRLSVGRPQISESAKRRRKSASQRNINLSRICIGSQLNRWNAVKAEVGAETNAEVAKILIDKFMFFQKENVLVNFLIKQCSSGKFFHPEGSSSNPHNDTPIVLHQDQHKNMIWTFEKVVDHWGYIKHVSSGKIIHPAGGSQTPGNDTQLVLHSDRHWGALFALDSINDHVIHKGGRYAHPEGGSHDPNNGTAVVLHSDVHEAMRFQFVTTNDSNKESLVYGNPTIAGKWKMINMERNPLAKHVVKLQVKIGKSTEESRTTSFQYKWEMSAGFDIELLKMSASQSIQSMMERSSSVTWSNEMTRTRKIQVSPGISVVTWQYVFDVQQNKSKSVFNSNLLAETDSESKIPEGYAV